MVSKKTNETGRKFLPVSSFKSLFKKGFLFLIAFLSISGFSIIGQNISKYYTFSSQENGYIYFVYPQKGFQNTSNGSDLIFDVTYLSDNDSLTFNYTIKNKELFNIDSARLIFNNSATVVSPSSEIYVKPSKSDLIYRQSVRFASADFYQFVSAVYPVQIQIICDKQTLVYEMKKNKWEKQSPIYTRIFDIIKMKK